MNTPVMLSQEELRTESEMSARYHSHRVAFLTKVHRVFMFLVALAGTAAVAQLDDWVSGMARLLGFATTIIVLVELVFDIQGARSVYHGLYQRFTLFLGEIASTPNPDEATLQRWNARLHELHADEPPVYRVLNDHVHNEMAIRLGNLDKIVPIKLWRRLLMHVFRFPGYDQNSREGN